MRTILGSYCDCAPEDLRFTYSDHQKPAMEMNGRRSGVVSFNLSHSGDAIQIAVAAQGELGIDVEHLARELDIDALLSECLTEEETRSVIRMTSAQRRAAFFRYWVHKEAFLKCVGCGFSVSPKEVRVLFGDGGRSTMSGPDQMKDVVLFGLDLPCESGYIAAIATGQHECVIESFVL